MKELILKNDKVQLGVLPELGASLSFLKYMTRNGNFRDILRPIDWYSRPDASSTALFPMIPFCGRIRGGSFVYFGITRKMAKNHMGIIDPIHGDGWKSTWKVQSQQDDKVVLTLKHNKNNGGFPFSYNAELIYSLQKTRLEIEMKITNPGHLPMPCGMGIHPFFVKTKDVELDFATQMVWSNESDPIFDKPYETPSTWQFQGGRPLKNAVFDTCFDGFDGKASILYPDTGITVNIEADNQFKHIVLYVPRGKNFFCLEPASNAINAFNLAANGIIGTGMKSIGPEQSMCGKLALEIHG